MFLQQYYQVLVIHTNVLTVQTFQKNLTDGDNVSVSSSSSSWTFEPDISDGESDKTFDGFDPSDLKPSSKMGKGSLNTVQYGLR